MRDSWEVEQKYVVDDLPLLHERLSELGFAELRVEHHCDTYFRHPSRDFRARDEAFRVRVQRGSAQVTYKGPRLPGKVKTRSEIELGIEYADQDSWFDLLGHLGFEPLPAVRKTRRVFEATGATKELRALVVAVDTVEQLGDFAEIEVLVRDREELDSARERVSELGADLGLQQVQSQSYLSQLLTKLGIE